MYVLSQKPSMGQQHPSKSNTTEFIFKPAELASSYEYLPRDPSTQERPTQARAPGQQTQLASDTQKTAYNYYVKLNAIN